MFAAHPELESQLFNRGNQKRGEQQQTLAGAIVGYAAPLLESDPADARHVLGRIANKHASLGVTPEQYSVVHIHLFGAIAEVLGDAITEEVADPSDEVFRQMTESLIAIESGLYESVDVAPGRVWRTVRVRERLLQSADTVSVVLTPSRGAPLPSFRPGQYLSDAAALSDGDRYVSTA
jgi:nitric oxide dioxygenase